MTIPYPRGPSAPAIVRRLIQERVLRQYPIQVERDDLTTAVGVDIIYNLSRMSSEWFPRYADLLLIAAEQEARRYETYQFKFATFIVELNTTGPKGRRRKKVTREYTAAQQRDIDMMVYGEGGSRPVELGGEGRSLRDKAEAIISMTETGSPGGYVNRLNPYRVLRMIVSVRDYVPSISPRTVRQR